MPNQNTSLEELVEQITNAVLARFDGQARDELHLSADHCLANCPHHLMSLIDAGGERLGMTFEQAAAACQIARYIDHTLLKPEATRDQIHKLCREADQYSFASVCVNPAWVREAASILRHSCVRVCTVAGFPLGANAPDTKAYEARRAIFDGAHEIDMVINIGALKSSDYDLVERDIRGVVEVCHEFGCLCKVIIETALLTTEEKVKACLLVKTAGADFVKTSTGFSKAGATIEDVALMRQVVGPSMGVKAAGGVKDFASAQEMIRAGATRIGASVGVKIAREAGGLREEHVSKIAY